MNCFPKAKNMVHGICFITKKGEMQHLCVFICLSDFHFEIEFRIHCDPQQSISQSFVKSRQINTVCACIVCLSSRDVTFILKILLYLRTANK